jgi:hypothetical protein
MILLNREDISDVYSTKLQKGIESQSQEEAINGTAKRISEAINGAAQMTKHL